MLVANVSAFALGFVLYRLAWCERHDDAFARRAVWLVYLLPPAFVLVMGYAEAMFMLLAADRAARGAASSWWVAAVAGFVAGLPRPVGLLLAVPRSSKRCAPPRAHAARHHRPCRRGRGAGCSAASRTSSWARDRTDIFLSPLQVQEDPVRRGSMRFPLTNVADVVRDFSTGDHVSAGVHSSRSRSCVGLLFVLARRWPASFTLYAAARWSSRSPARNLDSLERYSLSTVPFVLALADVLDTDGRERTVLVLAAAGLVAASVLAFTGALVP